MKGIDFEEQKIKNLKYQGKINTNIRYHSQLIIRVDLKLKKLIFKTIWIYLKLTHLRNNQALNNGNKALRNNCVLRMNCPLLAY